MGPSKNCRTNKREVRRANVMGLGVLKGKAHCFYKLFCKGFDVSFRKGLRVCENTEAPSSSSSSPFQAMAFEQTLLVSG